MGIPNNWEMVKDLDGYHDFTAPGVDFSCVHGVGVPTLERMDFGNGFENPNPGQALGDGDGTVNYRSLSACKFWPEQHRIQDNHTVNRLEIPKAEHYDILSDHQAINHILNQLDLASDYVPSPKKPARQPMMKIRLF